MYKRQVQKGSSKPHTDKVGTLTRAQAEEIAKAKGPDLTAADLDAAVRTIAGLSLIHISRWRGPASSKPAAAFRCRASATNNSPKPNPSICAATPERDQEPT